jgi:hypothetical protein
MRGTTNTTNYQTRYDGETGSNDIDDEFPHPRKTLYIRWQKFLLNRDWEQSSARKINNLDGLLQLSLKKVVG